MIVGKVTASETFIVCGTNYYNPTCEYRLVSLQCLWVGVAVYHMILLQKSDLSLVRRHFSAGFCPEQPKVPMTFVESGERFVTDGICGRSCDGTVQYIKW